MKKTILLLSLLTTISSSLFGGIYRHDVLVSKYKNLAAEKQFDCVGQVFKGFDGEGRGSCVLIEDRYVLSAAHVFMESDNVVDTQYVANGDTITLFKQVNERVGDAKGYTFRFNRRRYQSKRIIMFPAYKDSMGKRLGDLVVIELEEPVTDVKPAVMYNEYNELKALVTGVGYGVSGRADKPEEVDIYMEKIAGQNIIDSIGGYHVSGKPSVLMADFDAPSNSTWNKMGSAEPVELEYGVGAGDSGGPLFMKTENGWRLIGICTGGGVILDELMERGYYSKMSEWLRVSVFSEWITNTMNEMKVTKVNSK